MLCTFTGCIGFGANFSSASSRNGTDFEQKSLLDIPSDTGKLRRLICLNDQSLRGGEEARG